MRPALTKIANGSGPGVRFPCLRPVLILLLFGVAFGYLEAAVVSYLRILHEPARRHFYPDRPSGELFPLLTLEQVRAAGPEQQKTLFVEIGREASTLLMLCWVGRLPCSRGTFFS